MNFPGYLHRIGYTQNVTVDSKTLFELQRAHLFNVPFENLDIHRSKPIVLDVNSIFNKVINQGRGGFCYELNGLFYSLLQNLGFDVHLISARVYDSKIGEYGQEYDHMAIIAHVEGKRYLVDVGFGRFSLYPLELTFKKPLVDDFGEFLFDCYDDDYYSVNQRDGDKLIPQYMFTTKKRQLSEFSAMCHYHQTSKKSHFTQKKVISISTENGRITLNNTHLKLTEGEKIKNVTFEETEFDHYLKKYFKIDLNAENQQAS